MTTSNALDGRVAVVTGASSGIGAATARRLAADGARVALLARRSDRIQALAEQIGERAVAVQVDVTDASALDAAAETVTSTLGPADLVVANAGVMLVAPFAEGRRAEWERMLDLNVLGVLDTARAFLPGLLAAADAGRPADLMIVSSLGARQFTPGFNVYSATKAAASTIAATLRVELGGRGLRVTNVEPGVTNSELGEKVEHPEWRRMLLERKAQMRPLDAADVAGAIAENAARPANVHVRALVIEPTILM